VIIERTHYFAKPGLAAEVLAMRRRACDVRIAIGLPAGTVRAKADAAADGPDVAWECAFPDAATRAADLAARDASPEFEAVRAGMRALIERFERLVEADDAIALEGVSIVPEEVEFRSGARTLKGYLFRPPGPGPHPAMIHNHGSGLDKGSADSTQPGVAAMLMSWGIACFHPHRHGYGNSPGPTWKEDCPDPMFSDAYNRQLLARLDRESDDVVAAHAALRAMPGIVADRIGVMGSSFGGVNTLFAAAKDARFRCAVEFAGAAMNWDRNPALAAAMIERAKAARPPVFYIQAANDFSIRPTQEIAAALAGTARVFEAKIFPAFGLTAWEGHLFAGRAPHLWGPDVRRFLQRWL
jgi:dienelactone hydrolase